MACRDKAMPVSHVFLTAQAALCKRNYHAKKIAEECLSGIKTNLCVFYRVQAMSELCSSNSKVKLCVFYCVQTMSEKRSSHSDVVFYCVQAMSEVYLSSINLKVLGFFH